MIPNDYVDTEQNLIGLRLQQDSDYAVEIGIQTLAVHCLYFDSDTETWLGTGCWVSLYHTSPFFSFILKCVQPKFIYNTRTPTCMNI